MNTVDSIAIHRNIPIINTSQGYLGDVVVVRCPPAEQKDPGSIHGTTNHLLGYCPVTVMTHYIGGDAV